ncbi:MAG: alpha/beta hydrolase [Roseofilum sp. SBFL]|uniref:alpha/beta hydrolase n=1 Tax=unclassified Roseofilum TaxID=2620099 RepID=UPI001B2BF924|nr:MULTISPECIES: alpha/beta hydrolase [unclassified Roseofilum]MBP0014061.1 alpha/beta hydrolase [Roseofilum sp. SID3]MBP0026686.1 alpha/beta hydrolase [Roseofilum sp. SID2]MBP0038565.1 alpha/beta hydrolase [Roseofilum sp. SID1]MBP0040806.1 alpha/beta hydrolase [Roseofilum sp. SBFL]
MDRVSINALGRFRQSAIATLLGTAASAASIVCFAPTAQAADTIIFKYKSEQITLEVRELRDFARTGEIPSDLRRFLDDTDQVPSEVQDVLNLSIRVNPNFLRDLIDTSTGEFVVLKLDEAIASSASRQDLDAVKNTLLEAVEDDGELSIIGLLERYPIETITVDITNLEPVYLQAKALIERIIPALEVAKRFLQDIVCECEETSNLPTTEGLSASASSSNSCKPSTYTAEVTEEGIVIKDIADDSIVLESVSFTNLSRLSASVE